MKQRIKKIVKEILLRRGFEVRRALSSGPIHSFDHTFERLEFMRGLGFYPRTVFDVGASDGQWTRNCLSVFEEAQFFCVEPLDNNQYYLSRLNIEHPNVRYWQGCLGSEAGMQIMNEEGVGSSLLPGHTGNPYGIQRKVRVETMNNLLKRGICPQPDLIKLDVQGYELEVLKGATDALRKTQAIIMEVSFFPFQTGMPMFNEVIHQLSEYGFVVHDILSLFFRPLDSSSAQTDLLFLKAAHPLRSSNKWDLDSIY